MIKNADSFRVGDKIVDFGKIYRIFEIRDQELQGGNKEKVICYRPYFKGKRTDTLVCSIPISNIDKTKIRRPMSKKRLKSVFEHLATKSEMEFVDISDAKSVIGFNRPKKLAKMIRALWEDKNNDDTNFTKRKEETYEFLISRLAEEVAYVRGWTVEDATQKIKVALKRK